jgi:hypothetical protein
VKKFIIGAIIISGITAGCFSPRKDPVNFVKEKLGFSGEDFKDSLYSAEWSRKRESGQQYYVFLTFTLPEAYEYDSGNSLKRDMAIIAGLEKIFLNAPYGKVQIVNSTNIQSDRSLWTTAGYQADKQFDDSFEMRDALIEDCAEYLNSSGKPYFTALEKSIFRITFMVDLDSENFMITSINGVNCFQCAAGNTFRAITLPDENALFSIRNPDEDSVMYVLSMLTGNDPYK